MTGNGGLGCRQKCWQTVLSWCTPASFCTDWPLPFKSNIGLAALEHTRGPSALSPVPFAGRVQLIGMLLSLVPPASDPWLQAYWYPSLGVVQQVQVLPVRDAALERTLQPVTGFEELIRSLPAEPPASAPAAGTRAEQQQGSRGRDHSSGAAGEAGAPAGAGEGQTCAADLGGSGSAKQPRGPVVGQRSGAELSSVLGQLQQEHTPLPVNMTSLQLGAG